MSTEVLHFEVTLGKTCWKKNPKFSVWVDNEKIIQDELVLDTQTFKFKQQFEAGSHELKIRLENKTVSDTVLEDGLVVKDLLLNIENIVIDDIGLGNLLWSAEYLLDHPQEYQGKTIDHLDHCVNLGWNGTYILKFSSPFYIWLLEKL